jgi:ABC-type dipeptide/oligopeptide/nickel transport system ATPase component
VALVFQDPMTRLNPLMTIGDHCIETLRAHRPEVSTGFSEVRSTSACSAHAEWIEEQLKAKRNAMGIYQDLVDTRGFTYGYSSVKRVAV